MKMPRTEVYGEEKRVEELPLFQEEKAEEATPLMEIKVETEVEKVEETYPDLFYTDLSGIQGKAPEWIIEGCIQSGGSVNLLIAFQNTGKTFVVQDWCLTYVTGATSWKGKKITSVSKERRIVYLCSEGSKEAFKVRINGWLQEHKRTEEDLKNRFIFLNLKELLRVADGDIKLTKKNIEIITVSLKAKGFNTVDLFVIDTLNGFEDTRDENDNTACGNFINNVVNLMNTFDGNSLIIHHAGTASIGKPIEEIRARGASSLESRVDNETVLLGSITRGLEVYNRKSRDSEKKRFFIRGKVTRVNYNTLPDSTGEYPTTIVIDNTPSEDIETEVKRDEEEAKEAKNFSRNETLSKTVSSVYEIVREGLQTEQLVFNREEDGAFSFFKKDLKQYLIDERKFSKGKAEKWILNEQNRECIGKLIDIGMLSTNAGKDGVKTSQVKFTTRNNDLYRFEVGDWDFKTDSEIDSENSTENGNSTE